MKKFIISFAQSLNYKYGHPERTAIKRTGLDFTVQVWPNRASMAKSIRMQESRAYKGSDWSAIIPLKDNE